MSDMIFKNHDDLSLLDQFRLHVKQRQIDEVLRRSYNIVQDNLKATLDVTEDDINALVDMPPSERYKMDMTSERDTTSLKFRWFITISVKGNSKKPYDHLFKDGEKHVKDTSFRIIISPKHIGYELNSNGQRRMFRFVSSKLEDHQLGLNDIDKNTRKEAIKEVHMALAEWIARSCPDHAALYFMAQPHLLDLLEQHFSTDSQEHRLQTSASYSAEYETAPPAQESKALTHEINMPSIRLDSFGQHLSNRNSKEKNYEYLTRPTLGKPTYR